MKTNINEVFDIEDQVSMIQHYCSVDERHGDFSVHKLNVCLRELSNLPSISVYCLNKALELGAKRPDDLSFEQKMKIRFYRFVILIALEINKSKIIRSIK